jgi:formylmethanofuran dehydrogenase subunit B
VQGKPVDPGRGSVAGVPLADWQALAGRLRQCRFGVLFLDSAPPTGARAAEAAYGLAADLNRPTRFYSIALRRPGNGLGAEQVAAWQTGFPGAIGLHRGYPRSFGDEYAAASVLNRGEADAALIVGDPLTELIPAARDCLQRIPIIALSSQVSATSQVAAVVLTSAACASHAPATVFRFDGLALPLRPAIRSSFPDDFRVLSALAQGFRRGVPPA